MIYRCLVLASALALVPAVALAQQAPPAPNPQAEQLNEQGKELYKNKDYQGAAAKFREANQIQPDGRYYFNLCATLEKAGDLDAALEACDSVYQYNPNDELKAKTGQRAASIRQSVRQRSQQNGQPPPPPGPGDNNQPPPNNNNPPGPGGPGGPGQPPMGGPIPPGPEAPKTPGEYKWAFGGEFGVLAAVDKNITPGFNGGGLLRLNADKTFGPKLGGRLFFGIGGSTGAPTGGDVTTTLVEFGAAGFTNVKLANNLYITPTLGVLLAGIQESVSTDIGVSGDESYGTFGVQVGLPLTYTFGGGKHAIYVNPLAFTYYMPSTSNNGGVDNTKFDGGSTYMISFGYQLRLQEGEKLPGFVVLE